MSSVTLYIQGHGLEMLEIPLPVYGQSVQLLSFSGEVFVNGLMQICEKSGKSIDDEVIDTIQSYYLENPHITQSSIFKQFPKILKDMYTDCDIRFEKGFRITFPHNEREFHLKPNEGEDSSFVSEYGFTVVASSDPNDNEYTLQGSPHKQTKELNWQMTHSNFFYWINKATTMPRAKMEEYKKLFLKDKIIYLSNIIDLFLSIGFDKIYIYDPTCRHANHVLRSVHHYLPHQRKTIKKTANRLESGPYVFDTDNRKYKRDMLEYDVGYAKDVIDDQFNGITRTQPPKYWTDHVEPVVVSNKRHKIRHDPDGQQSEYAYVLNTGITGGKYKTNRRKKNHRRKKTRQSKRNKKTRQSKRNNKTKRKLHRHKKR